MFHWKNPEFDEVSLETIIGRLSRLRSFRYPFCFPSLWHFMVLFANRFQLEYQHPYTRTCDNILEQRWPDVELRVGNYDRPELDTRLLSSPLLQSLSFCVLNHTTTLVATDQLAQYSYFSELREMLQKAPNLKELDIKFQYNWRRRRVDWSGKTTRALNLPLESSDRLPSLHKLSFSGPPETYEFSLEHCQLLK